jgi:hypothetical protein
MRKFRNAFNCYDPNPHVQMEKCRKILRKLEDSASRNPRAIVRLDRAAKKYESTLRRMGVLLTQIYPFGVPRTAI